MIEPIDIRNDFVVFESHPDLVYLDSASTSLVPRATVSAVSDFLNSTTSSSRRGAHKLAVMGSTTVEATRSTLAKFLETSPSQLSFQKSIPTTIASFAYGFDWEGTKKRKIVVAGNEEHSVFVALQRVSTILGLEFTTISTDSTGRLESTELEDSIDEMTGIVAIGHVTVGTGTRNNIKEIAALAHKNDAILLTDATRSVGLTLKNIASLNADLVTFSANIGLMGPPGLTVQWINEKLGSEHTPGILGGSAVTNVNSISHEVALQPDKFESGTLNVPAIAGLKSSIEYLAGLHSSGMQQHIQKLSRHLLEGLSQIDGIVIYGAPNDESTIFGINIGKDNGINCHDVALFLDDSNIAVRSGLLCAHPLVTPIHLEGMIQISIHVYNTTSDIEKLITILRTISEQLM
jgi:cysteine desulfurase/selenocysteine lyase